MEILADKYKLVNNQLCTASEGEHNRQDVIERLIVFITLTEEDRLKAGIYVGNEGRDWIGRSALILPLSNDQE